MPEPMNLQAFLAAHGADDPAVDQVVTVMAEASREIAATIQLGTLAGRMGDAHGERNADGDEQKALDVIAHDAFTEALRRAPVALVASEESDSTVTLDADAPLAVAMDPLDGSSNIDTNVSIGTIFSILPARAGEPGEASFLVPGREQLGAGFIIYGPQVSLVMTVRRGTHIFTLDPARGEFLLAQQDVWIHPARTEYAINASNYRHWDECVRTYIDDCLAGEDGPLGANFNMRWIASMVADAYRILVRGGIFLYPGDERRGYQQGRLRLLYEANPMALIFEEAGGAATDTVNRILDIRPRNLHQRTPLVFGSADKVERVVRYHTDPSHDFTRSPLFSHRGLLRV